MMVTFVLMEEKAEKVLSLIQESDNPVNLSEQKRVALQVMKVVKNRTV